MSIPSLLLEDNSLGWFSERRQKKLIKELLEKKIDNLSDEVYYLNRELNKFKNKSIRELNRDIRQNKPVHFQPIDH